MSRELVKPGAGAPTTEERLEKSIGKVQTILADYRTQLKALKEKRRTYSQLDSVSHGLYDEIDKLSKKSHVGLLTDLALTRVNDTIRVAKELMDDDVYIAKINQFVPAGENPSHGDAVVDLRQIRQGLSRYNDDMASNEKRIRAIINACQGMIYALKYRKDHGTRVEMHEMHEFSVPSIFFTKSTNSIKPYFSFDHEKVEGIDLEEYFAEDFNEK